MKALLAVVGVTLVWLVDGVAAQQRQGDFQHSAFRVLAPVPLPHEPLVLDTAEQHRIRVVVVAKGFAHPWSLAFLPDGGMLVTERAGRLRIVRNGVLDPQPITGVPQVHIFGGLFDLMDIERIVFNRRGEELRRESLLTELKKRVRDVRQGPDGLLYALVEDDSLGETGGETALLRIEPAP